MLFIKIIKKSEQKSINSKNTNKEKKKTKNKQGYNRFPCFWLLELKGKIKIKLRKGKRRIKIEDPLVYDQSGIS